MPIIYLGAPWWLGGTGGTSAPTWTSTSTASTTTTAWWDPNMGWAANDATQTATSIYYPQMIQVRVIGSADPVFVRPRPVPMPPPEAPAIIKARDRAQELLLDHLTDEQRKQLAELGWFVVIGGKSGRRYRIKNNHYAGNVSLLHAAGEEAEAHFCGHCSGDIPLGDQLLAQKIMLEAEEDRYLALANRSAARGR